MIIEKHGDVFQTDAKIIMNLVNCQSRFISPMAIQLKEKRPHVYKKYYDFIVESKGLKVKPLGVAQIVPLDFKYRDCTIGDIRYHGQYIVNAFVRDGVYDDIESDAFKKVLKIVEDRRNRRDGLYGATVAIQNEGGITEKLHKMIKKYLKDFNVEIWNND